MVQRTLSENSIKLLEFVKRTEPRLREYFLVNSNQVDTNSNQVDTNTQ